MSGDKLRHMVAPSSARGNRRQAVACGGLGLLAWGMGGVAPAWALGDLGIRIVIAPSYSDIFSGNAVKNGILPVVLPQAAIDRLLEVAASDPVHVDLEHQTVTTPFQDRFTFEIDPFRKMCLLGGLDEVGLTMARGEAIGGFEAQRTAAQPWLMRGTEAA